MDSTQSIARNLPAEYRGRLLRRPPLLDEPDLVGEFLDRTLRWNPTREPECLPAHERLSFDCFCVLGVLVASRVADSWTIPVRRAEIARFFQHQWSAGRTDRLLDELVRRRFLEAREYVVRKGSGWRTWTRFRVRSRWERAADARAIARRRRHR